VDPALALRRALKDLESTIQAQQATLNATYNTMLVSVARAKDKLDELLDA
jgi:hypothetical protein